MTTNRSSNTSIRPRGMRRLSRATLVAGALMLGASTFGYSPIAGAEWDIDAYDECVSRDSPNMNLCCIATGGQIGTGNRCIAPHDGPSLLQSASAEHKLGIHQPLLPTSTMGTPAN
jgi:hypothetical protein